MTTDRLDRPLRGCGCSTRLAHCLLNGGFSTLRDASGHSDEELLHIPNFGRKLLYELKHLLSGGELAESPIAIPPQQRNAQERQLAVLAYRRSGKTYREVAEHFGVSLERARQLVAAAERLEQQLQ